MSAKLTKPGLELLKLLSRGPRSGITDEKVVKSLTRQGLAERYSDQSTFVSDPHSWRITPAGRTALVAAETKGASHAE